MIIISDCRIQLWPEGGTMACMTKRITVQQAEEEFLRHNRPHIELGRAGTLEEVAAVVFLASKSASFIINKFNENKKGREIGNYFHASSSPSLSSCKSVLNLFCIRLVIDRVLQHLFHLK